MKDDEEKLNSRRRRNELEARFHRMCTYHENNYGTTYKMMKKKFKSQRRRISSAFS